MDEWTIVDEVDNIVGIWSNRVAIICGASHNIVSHGREPTVRFKKQIQAASAATQILARNPSNLNQIKVRSLIKHNGLKVCDMVLLLSS